MNTVNPEMIVLARELRGISQSELADAVSLSQATISRYESDLVEVAPDHLAAIAQFLERPTDFFSWNARTYGASCMFHRKNRRLSVSELRLIHAKVNLLRIQATRLLRQARIKSHYSFHLLDPKKHGGPEGCAKLLRQLWQLPPGPIRSVVRAIENAGGIVFRCPFGQTRVDGISQWALDDLKTPPVFFVHEDIPGDRQRLTLAHEIGHITMHHLPTDGDPEEEANRFAGEFLMPADEIGSELINMTLPKAAAKKSEWKVSMQAIVMRAYHLGKITQNQYTYLFRQISARGYRKCEPLPIPAEEPETFGELLRYHRTALRKDETEMSSLLGELGPNYKNLYSGNFSGFKLVV